jgi:hypothetical protein
MSWSFRILHDLGELQRFASNQLFKYATVYVVIHYAKATYHGVTSAGLCRLAVVIYQAYCSIS